MEELYFDESNPEGLVIGNIADAEPMEFVRSLNIKQGPLSLEDLIYDDSDVEFV